MTTTSQHVIGGVDTHKDTHHAAVITAAGQLLADREFPATNRGHRALLEWLASFGALDAVGIEGTSSYGAGLTRVIGAAGTAVFEVNRPDRAARRRKGKSDQLDSEQAARSVLAGTATAIPKLKSGNVEAVRILRVTRSTAVKAKTQAMNALQSILVTAPTELRENLLETRGRELIKRCSQLRPETSKVSELLEHADRMHAAATKIALRDLARRWLSLDRESKELTEQIRALVEHIAPDLVALHGVGPEIAGQLLITAGDNTDRLDTEAAFAKLCGVAPQPASSGKSTGRHRLSRSGDRGANSALYLIAITRMRRHEPTRNYMARRTAEGLSKREILRCLKRYIAREVFAALPRTESPTTLLRAV
jgi:transposase